MTGRKSILVAISALLLGTLACNAILPTLSTPEAVPVVIVEPVFTPSRDDFPLTEADVPRVSLEEAKAALESGAAIVLDVRRRDSYAASHIPGALSIPIDEIEADPTNLNLGENQWIITYCT